MPPLVPTSALYSARPRLRLDGRDAPGLVDGLLSLVVEETTAGLYRCEAVFGNWGTKGGGPGFLFFDRGTFDFGKPLEVDMGDGQAAAKVFTGKITGLEARFPEGRPPELTVLAEDRLQDLRMTRRSRTFEDSSDADAARWIASKHGLKTQVDLDGPTHAVLAQVNQSDLAFLRERARAADAEVWVEGDTLHVQARARRNAGQVSLEYGRTLREFSVLADLAGQRTSLTVSGWDVAAKEGIAGDASESAVQSELSGGDSGGRILKSAFGDRPERIVHLVSLTPGEADGLAKARFRGMARRFLTGQGISDGDARIRVGTRVDLKSVGPLFEGEYYVTEVRQTFDSAHGYRTRFAVERPNLGRP
jgi:phage protein D